MALAQYRKLTTLIVAGIFMFGLRYMGMTPDELAIYGIVLSDAQELIIEFLINLGIPAVFMTAQPNEKGDTIFRWWHWVLIGLAIVALLVVAVTVLF